MRTESNYAVLPEEEEEAGSSKDTEGLCKYFQIHAKT